MSRFCWLLCCFFFKQKTAYEMRISDWSSDVCSSDLGIETQADGKRRAFDTQVYTEDEIRRVAAVAFDLARERTGKVHSVEKANVMETGVLWRQEIGRASCRERVCQ